MSWTLRATPCAQTYLPSAEIEKRSLSMVYVDGVNFFNFSFFRRTGHREKRERRLDGGAAAVTAAVLTAGIRVKHLDTKAGRG